MRALVIPVIGSSHFQNTVVHRYADAGGIDIPITTAIFTVQGTFYDETGFARDLAVKPIWRRYTVYIVHPARGNQWAGEALVFKRSHVGNAFVNMRKEDKRGALKVARRYIYQSHRP